MAPAQLDAFGISGFPCLTAPPEPQFGWHRDSFALSQDYAEYEAGGFSGAGRTYRPPLGANMLCYLQDMTAASGPLRVVPRSHLGSPPTPLEADAVSPHPQGAHAMPLRRWQRGLTPVVWQSWCWISRQGTWSSFIPTS